MAKKMSWKECVDQGIITEGIPDNERLKQMLSMANIRLEFWDKKVSDKFIALKVEAYYDIIKELVFAHMYKGGFNCTNHLCLISYIKKQIPNFDFECDKIDELRQLRNEISYRGFTVKKDYLNRNEPEFKAIIERLKKEI
ncbi:hypothetical protein COY62_04155 [bacterium (Candidatus Howlettbacteria) CG_4_10_14_0_8_um_filter_40_9]|nr:MAG: hypothetical protein COY62_04155 [bacterium (Candidatus Howlettbacteria) CG_4_10_14_0_8_um_filter_40_9]